MQIPYLKMHGTGNLILLVDRRVQNSQPPSPERLRELADPDSGPGFDQMMWLFSASDSQCVAAYRVFNADGSEVEQCGNGVRCVAKFLAENDAIEQQFSLQGPTGEVHARVLADGKVAVSMGVPIFDPDAIPFLADRVGQTYALQVDGTEHDISAVSMGNPHCILRVNDVETAPVDRLGPQIEYHDRFPQRTNVGFVKIRDRLNIDLRVHERGVGETKACGTGACAAVVTGQRLGLLDADVQVRLPGGQVMVSWRGDGDPVWLTGNAERIDEGVMDL